MSLLNLNFGRSDTLGQVIYYMNRPEMWCWEVVDAEGNTIVSPSKSFHSRKEAEQSFRDIRLLWKFCTVNNARV